MSRLVVHDEADADVAEIAETYAQVSLDLAIRFTAAVRRTYEDLMSMPGMGALREFPHPRYAGVRSWPISGFDNFLLFYRPIPDGIEVIRLIHGARDFDRFFR